ncbi:AraC family transcriptional regulator [Pseudidiomarina sediminum]|uniref:AraC family transcriptional regulator n=1 Tax=Pseudidiomarina sediminum TaxID=431675 RepID=UPI001C97D51C|nr:AraC family transcriptional regulator [Pseudidiomarina sediminum]MBY6062716.1 AraC family transcriptional regulator [Pseudidiomarina sediminum]
MVQQYRETISSLLDRHTQGMEDVVTAIDGFGLFRREHTTEPCDCVVAPSMVLVTQGEKQLFIGEQTYSYDAKRFIISSLDVPARSQVLQASPEQPCLGMALRLDIALLTELISTHQLTPPATHRHTESTHIGTLSNDLLEPFLRLLKLLEVPADAAALAPLVQREIHYRLLQSDVASRLWQLATIGSSSQRIARAIDWLKHNYTKPLVIDDLAKHVQLSPSSLHHSFKQMTAKSPLQYQKWLRLNEARRLMFNDGFDASQAAFQVGYESASQFSREYSRHFGAPPKRDIEQLRTTSNIASSSTKNAW